MRTSGEERRLTEIESAGVTGGEPHARLGYSSPEALFRAHYSHLVRALTAVSADSEAAADAVQEAFVQLWLNWDKVAEYDAPVAWVHRVGLNRLRNQHRALGRLTRALARLGRERAPADPPPSSSLLAALSTLPYKQRVAVSLHFISGFTIAETAGTMGISPGSVSQHLSRGRAKLQNLLEET
ncbi:MAG: RNA polymerase sigma factor [Thermoleophilia bacterium]